ncbi:hypothetical protein [Hyphomicrobium sp.]
MRRYHAPIEVACHAERREPVNVGERQQHTRHDEHHMDDDQQ